MKQAIYLGVLIMMGASACAGGDATQYTEQDAGFGSLEEALTEETGPLCQTRPYVARVCTQSCRAMGSLHSCLMADECGWNGVRCDGRCASWAITTEAGDESCHSRGYSYECLTAPECFIGGSGPVAATLFRHSYERGMISQLGPGMSQNLRGANDSASSIRVASGYCARVYRDTGFRGSSLLFRAGVHGLRHLNDEVSSWEVVNCPPPPPPPEDPCRCLTLPTDQWEACSRNCRL